MQVNFNMRIKNITLVLITASLTWSCDSSKNNNEETDNFDVTQILTNVSENIIIERYKNLNETADELKSSVITFNSNVTQSNLDDLKNKFRLTYFAWQKCSAFKFGYAESNGLRGIFNTFPTDTNEIQTLLTLNNPNYEQGKYIDATGFPGLDYILFSHSDTDILNRFSVNSNKEGAKNYLLGVVNIISSKSNEAYLFWKNNTDGFKSDFSKDKSKAISSAFSNFVNEFVYDTEFLKNHQFSYPAGKYSPVQIEIIEAIHSGYNIQLLKTHLLSLKKLYLGEDEDGNNGIGLDDYLIELKSEKDGKLLNTLIIDQFDLIEAKIDINLDFIDAINNQPVLIEDIHNELLKLVSYVKVPMMNEFNVTLNFNSGDGDG